MALHERIRTDLRAAMKARDAARVSALRMVVAALQNAAVAAGLGPQGELADDAVARVLNTEVKRRREAAEAYRGGGRPDRVAAEEADVAVYAEYLPEQLDDADLLRIVEDTIAEVGAAGPKDIGTVMKAVMPRVAGRADGTRVSAMVRSKLLD